MNNIEFCEYATGLPPVFYNLLVTYETTGEWSQFYIEIEEEDGYVEVDWGDGHFLKYKSGVVFGQQKNPISNAPVLVRSPEEFTVTTIRFGKSPAYDNVFTEINIIKGQDLVNASRLCHRLENLQKFTFYGSNQITTFESAWEDCTELLEFKGMDTTRAVTLKRAWKNTNKLIHFPNIYAKECLTVEEAWMGCTSMMEFPIIDVSRCLNFNSAWRGNTNLLYFPYLDTSSGTKFSHTWAYNTKLKYFPALDFTVAKNMDFTFAYMKKIETMPFVNSINSLSFDSTFRKMLRLRCIAGVDTNSISSRDLTKNMFTDTPMLNNPTNVEQERIRDGWRYENSNPCYYDAGRSTFFAHCRTNGDETSFMVHGGDFEVDWGDGVYLPYNEGLVSDIPILSNDINIRSEEDIIRIDFISDTFKSVEIKRGQTLTGLDGMCQNKTNIEYFEILGYTRAVDFTDMLNGCTSLVEVGELNLRFAEDLTKLFFNNQSLVIVNQGEPLDIRNGINFTDMFTGCSSFEKIQKLITTSGKIFNRMFSNMSNITCIEGIDTRNQTNTDGMFNGTKNLKRPNANEITNIMNGTLYDNRGNCDNIFALSFTGAGGVCELSINAEFFIDWGDGQYLPYSAGEMAQRKPMGTAFVFSTFDADDIIFDSDEFEEISLLSCESLLTMKNKLTNKTKLKKFSMNHRAYVDSWANTFMGSGIVEFIGPENYDGCTDFTNMFKDTSSLNSVTAMNTKDGILFEGMFENTSLTCFDEINTCKADFPPSYLSCHPVPLWDCTGEIACDGEEFICAIIPCDSELQKFGHSTMFDGSAIVSPNTTEQNMIMNRYHYEGITPC